MLTFIKKKILENVLRIETDPVVVLNILPCAQRILRRRNHDSGSVKRI